LISNSIQTDCFIPSRFSQKNLTPGFKEVLCRIRAVLFSFAVLLSVVIAFQPVISHAQYYGQNKVNYEKHDWYYLHTQHFDIYHPKDEYKIAEFTAWAAEEALQSIQKSWNYSLKSRITFIVYPSHNAFQQTNVGGFIGESTGGFTEFLKNRVVIPYEGSYEIFRHVIHHELTHAVMLRMLYGEGVQSIVAGLSRMPLPLWFIEGLAEYESNFGWANEADLYMRDAVINDYLMPIDRLGGYFIYKGGQSVLYYIDQRYGSEKVGEILRRIRSHRDLNRAVLKALGIDLEELNKRWHRHVKREIWPSAADYEIPTDFAEQLTDHEKWHNFVNTSPALSPDGDKVVVLTDKDDYFNLYLFSTITGKIEKKLVKGQNIYLFEKLLWMRPWVSWSPDSREIVFVAESGPEDILYTLDVESGEVTQKFVLGLDGIFSPVWSPDMTKIAFAGFKRGQSDIYILEIEDGSLSRVTDDIFSDYDPAWNPDGSEIIFVSDRGDYLNAPPEGFEMWNHDYLRNDIYTININTYKTTRITNDPHIDRTPSWTPKADTISFVSDRNGVDNLYLKSLATGDSWAITNLLSGVTQPSWSKEGTLVFATFYKAGYDIYMYKNPFDPDRRKSPTRTAFQKSLNKKTEEMIGAGALVNTEISLIKSKLEQFHVEKPVYSSEPVKTDISTVLGTEEQNASAPHSEDVVPADIDLNTLLSEISDNIEINNIAEITDTSDSTPDNDTLSVHIPPSGGVRFVPDDQPGDVDQPLHNPYSNYVFRPKYLDDEQDDEKRKRKEKKDNGPLVDEDGNFVQSKYKLKFSPDIVNATAGYSTFFGLQGMGQMLFSDILGNHLIYVTTDLYYNFENSNFSFYYYHLPYRADFGGGIFHRVYFFNYGEIRDRNYGSSVDFAYPISKHKRIDFSGAFINIDREKWSFDNLQYYRIQRRHFLLPSLAFVSDNTIMGYTGPMNGQRWRVGFSYSPELGETDPVKSDDLWGLDFKTLSFDGRKYHHFGMDYVHAVRFAGATSWGKQSQTFFLGGVNNWINRRFAGGVLRDEIEEVYFSGFATPLRGTDYYEKSGDTYVLINNEFRFPLIRQVLFGWPLPIYISNIRGVLFHDIGAAWNSDEKFHGFEDPSSMGPRRFADIAQGFGWGWRLNLGIFLLKWDMAWENDWVDYSKPKFYVSIGADL